MQHFTDVASAHLESRKQLGLPEYSLVKSGNRADAVYGFLGLEEYAEVTTLESQGQNLQQCLHDTVGIVCFQLIVYEIY